MLNKHIILGVHITDRFSHAAGVQQLFSEYGRHIKTRLGLHDTEQDVSSPRGLVLLEMVGDESRCMELKAKLGAIDGVEVQQMIFEH